MSQSNIHLSPQDVITQVQQGKHHSTWSVYEANSIASMIGEFITLFISIAIIVTISMYIAHPFLPVIGDILNSPLVILLLSTALTITYQRELTKRHSHTLLVLLSDQVIYCHRGIAQDAYALHFSDIVSMQLSSHTYISKGYNTPVSSRTIYWLDIETIYGEYIKWDEQIRHFGDPQVMGQTIIAAYNYYKRQHG